MNSENNEAIDQNGPRGKPKYALRVDTIVFLIFFIIVVSFFSYINTNSKNNLNENKNVSPTDMLLTSNLETKSERPKQDEILKNEVDPLRGFLEFKNQMIFPSPDNYNFFYLFPELKNSNECHFGIVNLRGQPMDYDIYKILKTNKISCDFEYEYRYSSFHKWIDNYKFILKQDEDKLAIVSILDSSIELYPSRINNMEFVDVNKSLKYWLFKKDYIFNIIDINKNIVFDKLNYSADPNESIFYTVLYDRVNDGFLFISYRNLNNSFITIFDYFDLNNLIFKNILTTIPFEAEGRGGCVAPTLLPTLGEVVIDPGCVAVADRYISSDKKIHIKL